MHTERMRVRPFRLHEAASFFRKNVEAGFFPTNGEAQFKKALSIAEHVGVLSCGENIIGGFILFRRWENALWATNFFVSRAWQGKGASAAMYRYILDYCRQNAFPWLFANPISTKVKTLFERWGMVGLNNWEMVSLLPLYHLYFPQCDHSIPLDFRNQSDKTDLRTSNRNLSVYLQKKHETLRFTRTNRVTCSGEVRVIDMNKINRISGAVLVWQGWWFSPSSGLLFHRQMGLNIYAPTANARDLSGLSIPVNDIHSPKSWDITNNKLRSTYITLDGYEIEFLAIIDDNGAEISLSSSNGSTPRLRIESNLSKVGVSLDSPRSLLDRAQYDGLAHSIFSGLDSYLTVRLRFS